MWLSVRFCSTLYSAKAQTSGEVAFGIFILPFLSCLLRPSLKEGLFTYKGGGYTMDTDGPESGNPMPYKHLTASMADTISKTVLGSDLYDRIYFAYTHPPLWSY